jgi:predicted PurR-regulated permease PerM
MANGELIGPKRFQPYRLRPEVAIVRALVILATLAIIAALYFAKAILAPLALAVLITFVLAPAVRLLRRLHLGRVPSVAIVVTLASLSLVSIGSFLGEQLSEIAAKLPQYQYVIQGKVQTVSSALSGGTFEELSALLSRLNEQVGRAEGKPATPGSQPGQGGAENTPIPVEIHQPPPAPLEMLQKFLSPLLDPLTTLALVAIYVVFFLLERADLRDRMIRLAGSHDLQRTTEAINDAARRLSRYFLAQTALNTLFGIVIAIGLAVIGVPNPVLWGIVGMVLRFVPYIGAFIAAACPIMLAIAVDPGWSMGLWTLGLFLVVEPVMGQLIEPFVYGHSTGISPVAVIISATFWTWLWGPVGLLLSTPLMVCIGVLGRHIEWLEFVDVLIGQEAPLSPAQSFYQRALAGHQHEIADQAEQCLKHLSLLDYYDEVVLAALVLAQGDFRRGALDEAHVHHVNDTVRRLTDDLSTYEDKTPSELHPPLEPPVGDAMLQHPDLPVLSAEQGVSAWDGEIVCIAGRGPFDAVATALLCQLLAKHGLPVRDEPDLSPPGLVRLHSKKATIACLSTLDIAQSVAPLRFAIRRLRQQMAAMQLIVGLWGRDGEEPLVRELRGSVEADSIAHSLRDALALCIEAARAGATAVQPSGAEGQASGQLSGQASAAPASAAQR